MKVEKSSSEETTERIIKQLSEQIHPLDRYNWLQMIILGFLTPIYQYVATGKDCKSDLNFKIPEVIKHQNCVKRFRRIVQNQERGSFLWRHVSEFKMEFLAKFIMMQFSNALTIANIVMTRHLVEGLQAYIKAKASIQPQILSNTQLGSNQDTIALSEILKLIAVVIGIETIQLAHSAIYGMKRNLFYKKVATAYETFFFEEQLDSKFNNIHSKQFKINAEATANRMMRMIFQLMSAVQDITKVVFMTVYGFSLFGPKFSIILFGLILGSLYKFKAGMVYWRTSRKQLESRVEMDSVLSSVFDNLQYIKTNALEHYYYHKNESIREQVRREEMSQELSNNVKQRLFALINLAIKCLFFGAFLLDGGVLSAGFIKSFMDIESYVLGGRGINSIFGNFMQEIFLRASILGAACDEIEDFRVPAEEKERFREGSEELEVGTCELRGSFYWNLNKEQRLGERSKSNQKGGQAGLKKEPYQPSDTKVDSSGKEIGFELKDINFKAKRGSLVMIVGKIGSGKSSLMQALLGEMKTLKGSNSAIPSSRKYKGRVAYLGQKPWIMNATVKQNILLGKEYNEDFFNKCLRYAALEDDLTHWEKGVDHIVGKQGVALSGGQKARLALARCLYQDPDIYLIDDVTSALDVHVGGMVFNKTIKEFLREKTVVMTTHNIQILKDSDYVYYMDQGRVSIEGKYEEVQESELFQVFKKNQEFINSKSKENAIGDDLPVGEKDEATEGKLKDKVGQSIQSKPKNEKELNLGSKKSSVVEYFLTPEQDLKSKEVSRETYIGAFSELLGKQYLVVLGLIIFGGLLGNFKDRSLNHWSNRLQEVSSLKVFITYNLISLISELLIAVISWMTANANGRQGRKISSQMLYRVLHSSLEKFVDKIPKSTLKGKISRPWSISRLSGITRSAITTTLATLILVFNIYIQVGALCLISVALLSFYSFFGNKLKKKYVLDNRLFYRIYDSTKENYLSEMKNGLVPIKAMRLQGFLKKKYYGAMESLRNYEILEEMISSHQGLEAGLFKVFVFMLPIYFTFVVMDVRLSSEEVMVALFIQSMSSISSSLTSLSKLVGQFKGSIRSFEMCMWFKRVNPEPNLKTFEQDYNKYTDVDQKILKILQSELGTVYEEGLVSEGVIEVKNLSAKYSIHNRLILKDVAFKVKAGEKIGIVGRTGSGKSSLIKLFWRYLEPVEGSISVDGVDIAEMDLKSYRSQISVVTQDTSLVYGTLRENLDPFDALKSDKEVEDYLKNLGLKNKEFLKNGLSMKIEGSGTNMSLGERQVIALARVLLNPKKLVILDEATSSMDIKTEEFIQKEIETKLRDSTMLVIAHRLQTVMSCDRILVLEEGQVAVFDTFGRLMKSLERVKAGEEVEGATGVRFFGEAIEEITKAG